MRSSSRRTSRSGSGPPSTNRRVPSFASSRMASPWPISRTLTRSAGVGRATSATDVAATRATTSTAAGARRWRGGDGGRGGLQACGRLVAAVVWRNATTSAASATPAPMRSSGGASSTVANGTCASSSAPRVISTRGSQAATSRGANSVAESGPTMSGPAMVPMPAPSIASGTTGATSRLASGEMSESRPKWSRIRGSVESWAASDTPSASPNQRGPRAPVTRRTAASAGPPRASRPAVAASESCRPMSSIIVGCARSSPQQASPRAAAAPDGRPLSRATMTTPPMTAARTTLASAPARTCRPRWR